MPARTRALVVALRVAAGTSPRTRSGSPGPAGSAARARGAGRRASATVLPSRRRTGACRARGRWSVGLAEDSPAAESTTPAALAAAGVDEFDGVSGPRRRSRSRHGHGRAGACCRARVRRAARAPAPSLGRAHRAAAAARALRDRVDRAGAQLRSGEIERHRAMRRSRARPGALARSSRPGLGTSWAQLMRMTSMPASTRSRTRAGSLGRLGGHRDHDPRRASVAGAARERVRVRGEPRVAGVEQDRAEPRNVGLYRLARVVRTAPRAQPAATP